MRKITTVAVAALALAALLPASPAAADSSACTHHWSGPQVCIRLEGRNGWNAVTAIWTNPGTSVKTRRVHLYLRGSHVSTATARRVGKTVSHSWSGMQTGTDARVCVRFAGIDRVACDTTKYIGRRVSL